MANITQINVNGTTYDLKDNISGYTTAYDGTTTSDTKYDALFLETVGSGVDTVKVGLDIDLLWTNSSAGAVWPSQAVTLDSTGYSHLLVCCINSKNSVDYPVPFLIGKDSVHYGLMVGNYGRGVYATDTTVTFVDANNTATDRCVPYKIYGVR